MDGGSLWGRDVGVHERVGGTQHNWREYMHNCLRTFLNLHLSSDTGKENSTFTQACNFFSEAERSH